MFCLRCNSQMIRQNLKGVLIDYCINCKSIWLDKDELDNIRKGISSPKNCLIRQSKKEKKNQPVLSIKNACPRCFGQLYVWYEGGAKLDKCSRCEGMFFDRGELDKSLNSEKMTLMQKIFNILKLGGCNGR